MLQVRTYIAESPINGIGLYAAQNISKGTVIWDYTPFIDHMYSKHVITNMADNAVKKFIKKYAYLDADMGMPQYVLCGDDARFMNHAELPNTTNGEHPQTIALYDILIGEEITCNYYEIDDEANEKFKS